MTHNRTVFLVLACCLAHPLTSANAESWPCWRGPRADGTCIEQNIPANWDPAGATWKTEIPGQGHASAIVWGDRICTATALPETKERMLLCLDLRYRQDTLAADCRAGPAGEDPQREQLRFRHARHRR